MSRTDAKRTTIRQLLIGTGRTPASLSVSEVMTCHPLCVSPQASVLDLVQLFHEHGFRHLLVTEGDRLVGVISDRDVGVCFGPEESPNQETLRNILAEQIMSRDLITIGPKDSLAAALATLLDHGVNCLPVVDRNHLVGIVTSTDLYLVLQALMHSELPRPFSADGQ